MRESQCSVSWHQLMADSCCFSCPTRRADSGLLGEGSVLVGPIHTDEARLPPCPLGSENPFCLAPHPSPGLIRAGSSQGNRRFACLRLPHPSQSEPGPLSGAPLYQGLALSVAMAPAGDEALGGRRAGCREDSRRMVGARTLQLQGPLGPLNSGRGCWGPSRGQNLDPDCSIALHLARLPGWPSWAIGTGLVVDRALLSSARLLSSV